MVPNIRVNWQISSDNLARIACAPCHNSRVRCRQYTRSAMARLNASFLARNLNSTQNKLLLRVPRELFCYSSFFYLFLFATVFFILFIFSIFFSLFSMILQDFFHLVWITDDTYRYFTWFRMLIIHMDFFRKQFPYGMSVLLRVSEARVVFSECI